MSLPELEWQILYGRLAWAVVLAAMICMLLLRWGRFSRNGLSRRAAAVSLACTLPLLVLRDEVSPLYWLGLAFQWPSGLLVGLCLIKLHGAWQGQFHLTPMTPAVAAPVVLSGGALYLDAIGWIAEGFYYRGFGPIGAPMAALILMIGASLAVVRGYVPAQACALLAAIALFAVLRLPTGNLWDALLDPILWGWALVSIGTSAAGWWRHRGRTNRSQHAPA